MCVLRPILTDKTSDFVFFNIYVQHLTELILWYVINKMYMVGLVRFMSLSLVLLAPKILHCTCVFLSWLIVTHICI